MDTSQPSHGASWNNQQPAARNMRASEAGSRERTRQKKRPKRRAALASGLLILCIGLLTLGGGGYWLSHHGTNQPGMNPSPTAHATQAATAPNDASAMVMEPSPTPTPSPTATAVPALSPVPATVTGLSYLIMVSLSEQRMTAYDHGKPVLTTLVTTGKPTLYTPPGTYYITQHVPNSWFTSPWPKSSPNYYAPMYVHYGLRLNMTQIYIHDATWRTVFGPSVDPTQRSHGCVETPLNNMKWLYNWTPQGTMVVVVW